MGSGPDVHMCNRWTALGEFLPPPPASAGSAPPERERDGSAAGLARSPLPVFDCSPPTGRLAAEVLRNGFCRPGLQVMGLGGVSDGVYPTGATAFICRRRL